MQLEEHLVLLCATDYDDYGLQIMAIVSGLLSQDHTNPLMDLPWSKMYSGKEYSHIQHV
jgi:hypothetical protein